MIDATKKFQVERFLRFANFQNKAVKGAPAVFVDGECDRLTMTPVTLGALTMLSDSIVRLLNGLSNIALSIHFVPKQVYEHEASHQ